MICQHCGVIIPDSSHFCAGCGVLFNFSGTPVYKLNHAKLLRDTFKLYGRHFGIMGLIGLIYIGIPTVFEVYGEFTECPKYFIILESIVQCYACVVAIQQCLYTVRGGIGLKRNLMSSSLGLFLPMFGLTFSISCIVIAFTSPAFILAGIIYILPNLEKSSVAATIAIVSCMIGALILYCYSLIRLWLALFFLVDRKGGMFASIKNAWKISSGNFWTLFTSLIAFLIIPIFSSIVCGGFARVVLEWDADTVQEMRIAYIGLVPTIAIVWLGGALAYLQLTGQYHYLESACRFVILHHQSTSGVHWDVMLETDSALTTWAIPPQCQTGMSFTCPANRLPDHRKHYLDYEGKISDNRGVVFRINAGTYKQLSPEQFILHGTNFSGKLTIESSTMIFVPLKIS